MPVPWAMIILGLLSGGLILLGWAMQRFGDRIGRPGEPFLIPPIYIQLTGLILFIAFLAELTALITGTRWTPPMLR